VRKVFLALEVLRIEVPSELGGDPHKVYIVHLLRTRPEEVVWSEGRSRAFPSRAGFQVCCASRLSRGDQNCYVALLLLLVVRSAVFNFTDLLAPSFGFGKVNRTGPEGSQVRAGLFSFFRAVFLPQTKAVSKRNTSNRCSGNESIKGGGLLPG